MVSRPSTRFLQRLPQLITFFFSLTLVNGFRILADTFHWSTQPTFDFGDPSQVLVVVSFFVTLFWIVTAWLGYSLLVERYPYTLDLTRFFFDVARFCLMFAVLNFAFLAGKGTSYHVYVFTVALFYLMMALWNVREAGRIGEAARRREREGDARGHGVRFLTFLAIGLVYYLGVTLGLAGSASLAVRYCTIIASFAALVVWNLRRISELRAYALADDEEVASQPAGELPGTPRVMRRANG